jgi:2-dehydro-3-deoxyglucarate aldolase/4-hydroxy-2-oxoheptanedioate aldolase
MTVPANRLKAALRARERVPLGTWVMSASNVIAEAIGWAGFDFAVVDMEHSPIELPEVVHLLQAMAPTGCEPLLRVPWNDSVTVKRVLDAGARSLMFPMIQNAEEARAAVRATRYPPEGNRGVAVLHRASRYGTVPGYLAGAGAEIGVVVQLETPEAIAARDEIMAVDGVDAIFVGPGDLSASMGHLGNVKAPAVQAALRETAAAAAAKGVACGIVGPDPDTVRGYIDMGFSYVAVGSDLSLMMNRAAEVVSAFRGAPAAAKPSESVY